MNDITVFGATSFVGRILVRYLIDRHGVGGELRWAIAGRSAARLAALKAEFGVPALPTIVVDADDAQGLRSLCADTRVVVSTVGPYALHGEPLVAACAATVLRSSALSARQKRAAPRCTTSSSRTPIAP